MPSWWPSWCPGGSLGFQQLGDIEEGASVVEGGTRKHSWKNDIQTLGKLGPYLWPAGQWGLKTRVVIALIFLTLAKALTVTIPIAYKYAVDDLGKSVFPWHWILVYGALRLGSRASSDLRDAVFVRVTQAALRNSALDTFNHLHSLSLRFHLHRKTGGVLKALERGTSGISMLLSFVLFNILPTLLELLMTCTILLFSFEVWFSLLTLVTILGYVSYTLGVTEWRTKFRRIMNEKDNDANNKAVDSLLNFETVKYFCNEEHEAQRYDGALQGRMGAAVTSQESLAVLNIGQAAIIGIGSVSVMLLAGKRVIDGHMTVGDFVMVNTYILQLYLPLNFLGTSYRLIKQSLVDLENMFALFDQKQEVQDTDGAPPLNVQEGRVQFEHVAFAYDSVPVLHDVTFTIEPGCTTAVVGSTGAGKSTLSRLLFRFYDIQSGRVTIDGQDISTVTQKSLRRAIGVVPQDTVLFNDTIEYNVLYGRPSASLNEVYEACKLAKIHRFIMGLPEGYQTKVGERGLRLSGGEKQRISIARAILKDPRIMIFDEATSALDTGTEKEIQASLREVSKGRTTLVVAHRLSTIVDADEILVLKHGEIVERGTHDELLDLEGEYALMWQKQSEAESMALESKAKKDKELLG